uniref:Encoded protein n=1 Tax=Dunaliella salina TaxID=3046 RepID=A0ABQ7FRV9_DUNSA
MQVCLGLVAQVPKHHQSCLHLLLELLYHHPPCLQKAEVQEEVADERVRPQAQAACFHPQEGHGTENGMQAACPREELALHFTQHDERATEAARHTHTHTEHV